MYSGSTFTSLSGRLLGAHQKIDRVARHQLELLVPPCRFPSTKRILHFEGHNGPDAIKRKSPAKDEPWHYIQPFDEADTKLIGLIEAHYKQLVQALLADDLVRASFESAWLAHAVVDGLTPAHHYPFEEKLVKLRGGKGLESRTTVKEKIVFPGETLKDQASNNWQFWGPKGLFATHYTFEWGVATLIAPLRFRHAGPTEADFETFRALGLSGWFRKSAQDVARLGMYDDFYDIGWTISLARQVRRQLAPMLVRAVTVIWYNAASEAASLREAAS